MAIFTTSSQAQDTASINWGKGVSSNAPMQFSNDGSTLFTWDGFTIRAWTTSTMKMKAATAVAATSYAPAANGGGFYYTVGSPAKVYFFSYTSFTSTLIRTDNAGYETGLNLAVSSDGTKLVFETLNTSNSRYYLVICNASTGTQLGRIGLPPGYAAGPLAFVHGDARILCASAGGMRLHPASGTGGTPIGTRQTAGTYINQFALNPARTVAYGKDNSNNLVALDVTAASGLPVNWTSASSSIIEPFYTTSDGNALISTGVNASNTHYAFRSFSTANGAQLGQTMDYSTSIPTGYWAVSPSTNQLVFFSQEGYYHFQRWSFNTSDGSGSKLSDFAEGNGGSTLQAFGTNAAPRFTYYEGYGLTRVYNSNTGVFVSQTAPYNAVFSPDGTHYAYVGYRVSDSAYGAHIYRSSDDAHIASWVSNDAGQLGWGGNGHLWISQSNNLDAHVYSFNGSAMTLVRSFTSNTSSAHFLSSNGLRFVDYNSSGPSTVYNVTDGSTVGTFTYQVANAMSYFISAQVVGNQIMAHQWLSDSGTYTNKAFFFDLMTAGVPLVKSVSFDTTTYPYEWGQARVNSAGTIVAFTRGTGQDSNSTLWMNEIRLYRVQDNLLLKQYNNQLTDNSFRDAAFSADGSNLLTIGYYSGSMFGTNVQTVLSTVSVNPTSVIGGSNSTGTVTISRPAPAGGIVVTLGADAGLTVPANVTITEGNTSANFTVNTSAVDTAGAKTITATYDGLSLQTQLTVTPPTALTITFDPSSVNPGASSTGTVTLNGPAGPSGITVNLSSNKTSVTVPASVHFTSGQTTKTFTANTTDPGTTETATVTGTFGAVSGNGNLTITTIGATATFDVASIKGGNALVLTVTLASPAPAGGAVFTMTGDAVIDPFAGFTIAAGKTVAVYGINTKAVSADTVGTLTLTRNGTSKTVQATIKPPVVSAIYVPVTSVTGAQTVKLLVVLDGPAPTGGLVVPCSSNNTLITVPSTMTVPAGQFYATVDLTVKKTGSAKAPIITVGGKTVRINMRQAP